ncbi:hypothetical protein D9758_004071 [Tetrapyrgos nigripes]|uniref:Large ribosomal subunit protein uL5 C-terminal domain-containing protein n=1 Tax=Tetrapyrgos nigripes TaxID=182062 RepID=A0A8H5GL67_9AGAR|nr:hypothetical protein D9758_004071 [Tetrapyrgos nigripes]
MTVGRAASVVRFGRPPAIRKPLRVDPRTRLPHPPVKIVTRDFAPCRLEDHYYSTLQDDLMYLTYKHELGPRPPPRQIRLTYDPNNPYSKYRYNPPVGGSQLGRKPPPPCTAENVIQLEMVQLHIMHKKAITSRSHLLGPIMALRALSGETEKGGGQHALEGVQIIKSKKQVGGWIRKGIPVGAKVNLKGHAMYDFIGTLVDFVMPRIREFQGIELPPPSANTETPAAVSGVVSFGLPPSAMGFFPSNRSQPGRVSRNVWYAYTFRDQRNRCRCAG